ncbi:hypothetical protein SAMN04489835_4196 [Mycolicibacterium rutilum]|uniref:DUF7159 domain-containing protein n=1 Tax=Mycolicibacterium rutilum TaxID=370526 RepID=A0A1H6L598_MYCRU|nr:hypothetical protein [Mycolicibacterium rutilum]SEH79335.1 hypothetical protein SAMN04489835_4196 [Mycolicibacterium rutilum]
MDTVLGMSMTSSGIAWVLQQGTGADALTLDHDHFSVLSDVATDGDITKHEAAVRGARAIAEASGHQVRMIGLTWSNDVEAKAALLLKSLPDMGFDTVAAVPLADATQEWAQAYGRHLGFDRCALCVVEPSAVTVVSVLYNFVRTATTQMRESADGIARWLTGVFEVNRSQPESLYLLGTRGDLELIAGTLDEALPMPVVASDDAQLALARGAALRAVVQPEPAAKADVAEETVRLATSRPRSYARFKPHARVATVVAVAAVALFAIGPEFTADEETPVPTEAASSSTASTTSISVHAVPSAPKPPAVVQQLAAAPVPEAPPVAEVYLAPEVPTVAEAEPVPEAVPAVAEAPAEVAPVAPAPAAPVVATAPAPQILPAPLLPAPVLPPPAVLPPAPAAPLDPVPAPPAPAPPPPDPIQMVLSPLFGGLP